MPTYLYCLQSLADAGDVAGGALDVAGIDDAPVRGLHVGPLLVWVSEVAEGAPRATVARAAAHDRVVRAAMARETPLPARFGQTWPSSEGLTAAVAARESVFVAALAHVRGAVEMTVRVLLAVSESDSDTDSDTESDTRPSGRAYLARVRARVHAEEERARRADFLQARVREAIAPFLRDEVVQTLTPGSRSLSCAHLIPRDAVEAYRAALRPLRGAEEMRMLVSGPWAPYSFAPR